MISFGTILIILILERAAEALREEEPCEPYEMQNILKQRLFTRHGITVETKPVEEMSESLRIYDAERSVILLSEALDYQNRTFQLAHLYVSLNYPKS